MAQPRASTSENHEVRDTGHGRLPLTLRERSQTDEWASALDGSITVSDADMAEVRIAVPSSAKSEDVATSAKCGMQPPVTAAALPGPGATRPVVTMRNVHKTYLLGIEGVAALRGVTLDIQRGEFIVILGKSGGGKTTMLNILGTIDRPTRGDLHLAGTRVNQHTPDSVLAQLRLRKLGFVFQTFNLLPGLSALENVELPMVLAGWGSATERRSRATDLLSRVGMAERLHHVPSQMSGGEQQRVTIARALSNKPELLLLDEPTGDLDTVNTELVLKILTDLNSGPERVTCVLVTHDVGLKAYAHRVIHMLDGKINRIESNPEFVRQDALDALASAPAVRAWTALQNKSAAAVPVPSSTSAGVSGIGALSTAGKSVISKVASACGAAYSVACARISGYEQHSIDSSSPNNSSSTTIRPELVRSNSDAGWSGSGAESVDVASPGSTVHLTSPTAASDRSTAALADHAAKPTASHHSSGGGNREEAPSSTSTGLAGVAAISHAMFAGAHATSSADARGLGGHPHASGSNRPLTTIRNPNTYATHSYAVKAKILAAKEAAERADKEARKEGILRARVQTAASARRARDNPSAAAALDAPATAAPPNNTLAPLKQPLSDHAHGGSHDHHQPHARTSTATIAADVDLSVEPIAAAHLADLRVSISDASG